MRIPLARPETRPSRCPGERLRGTAAGVATFDDLHLDRSDRGVVLVATAPMAAGIAPVMSPPFDVAPGAAAGLRLLGQPAMGVAGQPLAPPLTVSVVDALGNPVASATTTFTVAIQQNPAAGTLAGATAADAVMGVATFSDLRIDRAGSPYVLRASTGLEAPSSVLFDPTSNRLWVGDTSNHRVLRYDGTATPVASGQAAVDGLGHLDGPQMELSRDRPNDAPNAQSFDIVDDVAIDPVAHRAFVADTANARVLVFNLSASNELVGGIPGHEQRRRLRPRADRLPGQLVRRRQCEPLLRPGAAAR